MSETERIYTVPLKEAWNAQRYRRSERAMMVLKAFAKRHMKAETITVDTTVNEAIWARGIKSPPHKIRVKMTKDDEGKVTITMAEVEAEIEAKEEPKKESKKDSKKGQRRSPRLSQRRRSRKSRRSKLRQKPRKNPR